MTTISRTLPRPLFEVESASDASTEPARAPNPSRKVSIKNSIAATLNTLKGTRLHARDLKNQRVSEEQLIFASTANKIARKSRALGRSFLKEVGATWNELRKVDKKFALFRAVDSELNELVREGKLSEPVGEKILRYALGKADLDNRITNVDDRRRWIPEARFGNRTSTNIERTIQVMRANRTATQQELDLVRTKLASVGNGKSDEQPSLDPDPCTPGRLPSPADEQTGESDMAYYPLSRETGRASLIVPAYYSDKVTEVEIRNSAGEFIERLDGSRLGCDGRRHFRSRHAGTELGGNITFVLRFTDGTELRKEVRFADTFAVWHYTF